MKRYFFWSLVIVFSLTLGHGIVSEWRGAVLSQKAVSEETLIKAIGMDPVNPAPFYKLGLLRQWSLLRTDPKESVRYLQEAIERNPFEQEYWLSWVKLMRTEERENEFERGLDNAIRVFPTGYRGRWIAGNLLLEQGELKKSLPHFAYILSHYPDQSSLVYDVFEKVVDDPDFVLDHLVPKDSSAFKQYLGHLYDAGDVKSVRAAWERKGAYGFLPEPKETLRHIDFLISKGQLREAFQHWERTLRDEGPRFSSNGALITNGGFETERSMGSGFDWRIGNVKGAEVSFDNSTSFEGRRSLKIVFDGEENVDFQQVAQVVAWEPDTDYALTARMKTKGVTTKSGVKLEILGTGCDFYRASESLIGDNEWRELAVKFRTPAQSQGGQVRVRRERTDKFDRLISGQVWIDDVSLSEESSVRP